MKKQRFNALPLAIAAVFLHSVLWSAPNGIKRRTGAGGVTRIVAGTNVSISPGSGKGAVTVNTTGVSGITIRNNGTLQGNVNTIDFTTNQTATVSGTTATVSASGGSSGVVNSTKTLTMVIGGGVYLSTISVFGIPGTARSPGFSTWTIVGMWADCARGSTVGVVGIDVLYSSGAVTPTISRLFNRIDVSTGSSSGVAYISNFKSSGSLVTPGSWLGLGVSTMAQSGTNATDCTCHVDYWEAPRY